MAKSEHQKLKLLYLYQYLLQQTDEEHPATVPELIEALRRRGVGAERKSIYDDLDALHMFGLDIQNRRGRPPGWFVGRREFELPELKLLVDAVQSSRFITRKKSNALIRKLEGLSSRYQAQQLQRQVYVGGQAKVMNENIYYNVDQLHAAIATRSTVTFRYFDYNMYRAKVFRREGKQYQVSPYGLIWSSENYYLAAYDKEYGEMRHYRVDKMAEIKVTGRPRDGEERYPNFDVAAYAQKHFGMFGGEETSVTLRCRSHMAGVVLDRFGLGTALVPEDETHFTVTLPLVLSPQFFGWLFGLEDNVVLVSPAGAAEAYLRKLETVTDLYR